MTLIRGIYSQSTMQQISGHYVISAQIELLITAICNFQQNKSKARKYFKTSNVKSIYYTSTYNLETLMPRVLLTESHFLSYELHTTHVFIRSQNTVLAGLFFFCYTGTRTLLTWHECKEFQTVHSPLPPTTSEIQFSLSPFPERW